ncbi:arginine N-succinyltransferase [Bdellovibrio sp. qaytius]|nr:arginine N-succinyltransferase [Bdellovibrio sp. qaytius]
MSFIVRAVNKDDITQLTDLAKQFNLLNLPGDKKIITEKVNRSVASFAGELSKDKSEYIFVVEDVEEQAVVGSSLIIAKHGSEAVPHCYFKILKRDHFSQDLGIGFIHQVLRFQLDTDGPTEIGGLLVDKAYRRRPERLGKQISLSRFVYMALNPDRFESRVLCELTPPLTDEGRSEFWEALGRRFTGLPYQEADALSQVNKEFIESLFPEEDIYLSLLDSKARLVLGRVGEATKPAQHLLENIGFQYLDEVDPFDGGPHYGCETAKIAPIKLGKKLRITEGKDPAFKQLGLVGVGSEDFKCMLTAYDIQDGYVAVPTKTRERLKLDLDQEVFVTPFEFGKKA